MASCVVDYEDWQMQCCGTPFKLGDAVEWPVMKATREDHPWIEIVDSIDYYYETHDSWSAEMLRLRGVVTDIKAIHIQYVPSPDNSRHLVAVSGSGIAVKVKKADGRDKDRKGMMFRGYVVTLNDFIVEPAGSQDASF